MDEATRKWIQEQAESLPVPGEDLARRLLAALRAGEDVRRQAGGSTDQAA